MKTILRQLLFFIFLVGCDSDAQKEMKMVSVNYNVSNSYCLGRHLINIPKSFSRVPISTGRFRNIEAHAQDPEFDVVVTEKIIPEIFLSEIQNRQTKLEGHGKRVDILRHVEKLDESSILFRVQRVGSAYFSELMALRGESMIKVRLDSFGDKYESAESKLKSFVSKIRVENEVRSGAGQAFCLGNIHISGEFGVESGGYFFKDKSGINVGIEIDTFVENDNNDLFSRVKGPDSLLAVFDVGHTVLRTREITVAGMRAQEWLAWAKLSDENNVRTHKFELETMRDSPDKFKPMINLTLDSAQPKDDGTRPNISVDDRQVIEIWDQVVASIRPVSR